MIKRKSGYVVLGDNDTFDSEHVCTVTFLTAEGEEELDESNGMAESLTRTFSRRFPSPSSWTFG